VVLRDIRHRGINRVPQHETSDRYLVETRTTRALKLLDLRRPKDANLVAGRKRPPKLSAAPKSAYNITREWAQQLHTRIPEIDGLIYESHQLPGDCVVLFQPIDPRVFKPSYRSRWQPLSSR
jgi:RES domain